MGVVYLARDPRLERDVAIKVLPDQLANDDDRLGRFQREAKVLAALNHTSIAAIYGSEQFDGKQYLVLEYVKGSSLDHRLEGGPLPLDEALLIARQIAEALEAAHENSIVHRDLKPANVVIRPDGAAKVLDFGLARMLEQPATVASGENSADSPTSLWPARAQSPTMEGVILGTAGYMSPEQARGKPVDKRSDIFSFGCVLYEMLTGRQPFRGESVADSLGAILHREPDLSILPPNTPSTLIKLLRRCLTKDRKQRLQDIGDARLELDQAIAELANPPLGFPAAAPDSSALKRSWIRRIVGVAVAGVTLVAAAAWWFSPRLPDSNTTTQAYHFTIPPLGHDTRGGRADFEFDIQSSPVLSPDGKHLVYGWQDKLWLRALGEAEPRALDGTEGGHWPFWSPDSHTIAFFSEKEDGGLWSISITGGPPQKLCNMANALRVGTWARDGTILCELRGDPEIDGLYVMRPGNSTPQRLPGFRHESQRKPILCSPSFLPDSRHFLFTSGVEGDVRIMVGSIDSPETQVLTHGDSMAKYAAPGYLLFVRDGRLVAQAFDAQALAVREEPRVLVDGVTNFTPMGQANFSVSQEGTLLYEPFGAASRMEWFDRHGRVVEAAAPANRYVAFRLSPEGKRLALALEEPRTGTQDLWMIDLGLDNIPTRLTSHPGCEGMPIWSPDGTRLAFLVDWQGTPNLCIQQVEGQNEAEVLVEYDGTPHMATDWSGNFVIYDRIVPKSGLHIWRVDCNTKESVQIVTGRSGHDFGGVVSPNGRLLAYCSTESGQREVYVQQFPDGGGRAAVSKDGGSEPCWRRDGKELFYWDQQQSLVAVAVDSEGPTLNVGKTESLFALRDGDRIDYDVAQDGQRFLIGLASHESQHPPDHIITNWTRLLERGASPGQK
jgi:eukaryotic-like serine/threonine-protein kinase